MKKRLEQAETDQTRVEILDENRERILKGVELLRERIAKLEAKLAHCKSRAHLVGVHENQISKSHLVLEHLYLLSRVNRCEEIEFFLQTFLQKDSK